MVVDDDPDVLFTVGEVLKKSGYQVMKAGGGEECIDLLLQKVPDLLLLDIMMPDMDGWEVLKEIRGKMDLYSLPVAMLTAKSFSENTLVSQDLKGLIEFVVKPFTKEKMTESQLINRGSNFFWIDKPFTREGLLQKVETIFDCTR
jgi:CheY-like chemotaxis protein